MEMTAKLHSSKLVATAASLAAIFTSLAAAFPKTKKSAGPFDFLALPALASAAGLCCLLAHCWLLGCSIGPVGHGPIARILSSVWPRRPAVVLLATR
eukprot:3044504-Pyramimonas_sp.AAC.1